MSACSKDKRQINEAAYGYLYALGNYRPNEARPYATTETAEVTLAFWERVMEHTDPSVYANNIPAEITIKEVRIVDTTAIAEFHKQTPSTEQDGEVNLVKRNNKWFVHEILDISNNPIMKEGAGKKRFSSEEIKQMRRNARTSNNADTAIVKKPSACLPAGQ